MRLLVGVDGSDTASVALRWAARLAARANGEVEIVTAFAPRSAEAAQPPRGLGGLLGLRVGGTAIQLAHHSRHPVILVPPEQVESA